MFALRLWLLVLSIALAIACALLVLMPRTLGQELDREFDARLERTQHAAALLLRVNARKWIDTSAQVASDAVLVESLDQATRGPADLQLVHKTVQDRLKYFNERMKVDLVLAVDAHGRVIARVGLDATIYKDGLEGYPLVSDALHGLRGDDTWSIGGKLYRVAASPVIQRDHYVGAIVIGQEATTELAESMKGALGTEVVLLLRGRVIASTAALPILDRLPIASSSLATELAHNARSTPLALDGWGVVFGVFAGEASEHQALFALCAPRHSTTSLPARLVAAVGRDPRALPWRLLAPIGGGALGIVVFGFILVSVFGARPLRRFSRAAQGLSRGELQRLPEPEFSGELGVAVRAINSTIERISGRVRAEGRASANSTPGIRTELPTPPAPAPALPAPAPPLVASTPAPTPAPVPMHVPPAAPVERLAVPPAPPRAPAPTLATDSFDSKKTAARAAWPLPAGEGPRDLFSQSLTPLPPPVQHLDTEPHDLNAPYELSAPYETSAPLPSLGALEPPPARPLSTAAALSTRQERPTARAIPAGRSFDEATSVESPSEAMLIAAAHGTSEEIEADFLRVFEEFVENRQRCGETMDGVTFDKFVVKLRHNRAQLIQRYGCTDVRFQVYVRDGKTALKATPIT